MQLVYLMWQVGIVVVVVDDVLCYCQLCLLVGLCGYDGFYFFMLQVVVLYDVCDLYFFWIIYYQNVVGMVDLGIGFYQQWYYEDYIGIGGGFGFVYGFVVDQWMQDGFQCMVCCWIVEDMLVYVGVVYGIVCIDEFVVEMIVDGIDGQVLWCGQGMGDGVGIDQ